MQGCLWACRIWQPCLEQGQGMDKCLAMLLRSVWSEVARLCDQLLRGWPGGWQPREGLLCQLHQLRVVHRPCS